MTLHVRDLHVEFEADDEDASFIVASLAALLDQQLESEQIRRRIDGYSVNVVRQVNEGVVA